MIPALQVSNVTKIYGNKKVVDNISFSIYPGQIYGQTAQENQQQSV